MGQDTYHTHLGGSGDKRVFGERGRVTPRFLVRAAAAPAAVPLRARPASHRSIVAVLVRTARLIWRQEGG